METGKTVLYDFVIIPLQAAWNRLVTSVPSILGALLILLVGGLIAKVIERFIVQGLKLLTLDKIADQIQLSTMLARGGIRRRLSELIGAIVYWIVMLAFVMTALNALGLDKAAELFNSFITYLPKVVAAVFVLVIGSFAAVFLSTTVRTAASNAGIVQAQLLGQAVQTTVVVISLVTALKQLEIQLIDQILLVILGGISLGCALAFGLGCKDLAGRWVNDLIAQLNTKKR